MLKNYFVIAFRNLKKHKVFSFVNIIGLAIGLAVFWLMTLYITDELTYDRHGSNADRLYRVVHTAEWANGGFKLAPTSAPFAPTLKNDYSEIEDAARVDLEGGGTLVYEDKKFDAGDICFADNSLLTMFQYTMLYGDAHTALATPHSMVITRSLAEKIFGNAENALHKSLNFQNDTGPVQITGVIEDVPENSHLRFSGLRSFDAGFAEGWQEFHLYTYVLLRKNADAKRLEAKLPAFFNAYLKTRMGEGTKYSMQLQPVTSIHLHSNYDYEISRNSDVRYIYLFSAVAILVLLIAVINYINLATARSSIRVKEIGVRKVVGSGRAQLVTLFLSESVLFTLISGGIAVTLAAILMPFFNHLADKDLSLWEFGVWPTITVLAIFSILTGIAGGLYPALFLSGFKTIPSLKGLQGHLKGNVIFRKALVTFQFVITIALIACSGILYQQMRYMLHRDLGFNKDQVLSFHIPNRSVREHITDLKARLLQNPLIEGASAAGNPIGLNNIGSNGYRFEENGQISTSSRVVQNFMVDASYLQTLQIQLAAGRNFSDDMPTDINQAVLVNETLVKELGWKDAIGKRVEYNNNGATAIAHIIGVVKDFNIYSLQHKIEPLMLFMPPTKRDQDNCYVRISQKNIPAALKYIEATYKIFDPASPFAYNFLDENFSRQYTSERKLGSLLLVFTSLAILIACLGLFGLVTFAVEQRTKEIGIRKVLGSTISGIVMLVSRDLLKPVLLAVLIATPLAWWAMYHWLKGFAYHIGISAWIFIGAGLLALIVALVTVSIKALRAAMENPAKSLRTE